ncbi:MAG: YggS family pyridoxal phosphate-dependent enzyme [Bacteroidales bacterium]|nr:YggS family pyridoxal phosphate-dependent enzyme [Bacteroidales bacterium]
MTTVQENISRVKAKLPSNVTLVAVSKTKPVEAILEAYESGQRIFGENKVQEIVAKRDLLPSDIQWHQIGHLQSNKVKYIAPFISMIHSVDSLKLLSVINENAKKCDRVIDCLLQFHIAEEETKFGFSIDEVVALLSSKEYAMMSNVRTCGVMGMATYTDDTEQIRKEFRNLHSYFVKLKQDFFSDSDSFKEISMGMSSDYMIAVEEGSTMVRIGSEIFGSRVYA